MDSGRPDSVIIQDKNGNHWLFTWAPIREDSGRITAIIKTITNINNETFLKKELTFQEKFMAAIVEHIPVGLVIINEHGEIEYINKPLAKRWGYEPDLILGKNLQELDIYRQQFLLQIILNAMSNDKRLNNIEYNYEKADKTNWTVTCSFIPLTLPDNRKMGLLVETDITAQTAQRQKAEQKAAKLDKELLNLEKTVIEQEKLAAIGQLAASMTHELNTPTTYIRGNLQTFSKYGTALNGYLQKLNGDIDENSRVSVIKRIESLISSMEDISTSALQGTERIMNIVSSMRGFVRDDQTREEQVNLLQPMTDALVLTYNRLKHIGRATINDWQFSPVETQQFIDLHNIIIKGNPQRLCQLFVILLNNSIDAWTELSSIGRKNTSPLMIKISAEIQGKIILCSVCDNSGGMTAETAEKVFEPFFTTKKGGKGTGLGMSICRQIVREHHGTITLKNHCDSGVCWHITLRNRAA
jgi:PAS domain S-box-containing protein